jgi:outer membrane lipoprotein-sorting protein
MHLRSSRAACILLFALSAATAAGAQTAEEIAARNVEAKGGAERWKSLTSVKLSGRVILKDREFPLTIYAKRPNLIRHEMTIKDMHVVQAFDGTTAWAINPKGIPEALPAAAADMMKMSAEFEGALIDYKSKGHTVELVGSEKIDGADVHHLKLTLKSGQVQDYYIDAKTGLESRMTQEVDLGNGIRQTHSTDVSDYREVGGIRMPHSIVQSVQGNVATRMTIDKVEFNTVKDDSIFGMPKR